MTSRKRMRRTLPASVPTGGDRTEPTSGPVTFPSIPETKQRTFNLDEIKLPENVKDVFRFAIQHHPSPIAHATQIGYWHAIATFARFAEEDGVRSASDLTTECIERYQEWLGRQTTKHTGAPWSEVHRGRKVISLRELIRTVKTWKPGLLPAEIVFPTFCYPGGTPRRNRPERHLTRGELKSLMWVCQQEIKENAERLERGRKILTGTQNETIPGMREALHTVEKLTQTGVATKYRLRAEGISSELIRKLGHTEGLRSHLVATPRTLAPIFVSLLVQLAANVECIRKLKADCARDHEMDERRVVIEWHKPRAGDAKRGTQRRFADRTKRYGALALITMVIAMTKPVRGLAKAEDRNKLFLCESVAGRESGYGVISYPILQRAVGQFLDDGRARIAEWNKTHPKQTREQIGTFDLRDIRGSVALEHYMASDGDIRSAQRVLNHRHSATTRPYIEGRRTKEKNLQILDEVIRQMTRNVARASTRDATGDTHKQIAQTQGKPASASFTNECRAPQREDGQLCTHFQQCLDCPGLVVPKTVEQLARLLQAEETFRRAKGILHHQRWDWLYAKSYATLTTKILPQFPSTMSAEARTLMESLPPLPDLD